MFNKNLQGAMVSNLGAAIAKLTSEQQILIQAYTEEYQKHYDAYNIVYTKLLENDKELLFLQKQADKEKHFFKKVFNNNTKDLIAQIKQKQQEQRKLEQQCILLKNNPPPLVRYELAMMGNKIFTIKL